MVSPTTEEIAEFRAWQGKQAEKRAKSLIKRTAEKIVLERYEAEVQVEIRRLQS